MKLLESTESKIIRDAQAENVPYLEITEAVLIHCNVVNNSYQQESCIHLFIINCLAWKFYIFESIWFRIFIYWSMAYRVKF